MPKLTDLIGTYDNLGEDPSVLNHPQNILGLTISFMVRTFMGKPLLIRRPELPDKRPNSEVQTFN